jgi:hypothetical protein
MIYGHARFLILTGENMTTPLRPLIIGGFRAGATVSRIEKKAKLLELLWILIEPSGYFNRRYGGEERKKTVIMCESTFAVGAVRRRRRRRKVGATTTNRIPRLWNATVSNPRNLCKSALKLVKSWKFAEIINFTLVQTRNHILINVSPFAAYII